MTTFTPELECLLEQIHTASILELSLLSWEKGTHSKFY